MIDFGHVVQVHFAGQSEKIIMGRLLSRERNIFFEYAPEFLKTDLQLSPFKLPLKPGVLLCDDQLFDGLFGIFNDSLPDGWGRLLLDRKLMSAGIHPNQLTPLNRLCYVGSRGMGALTYQPETESILSLLHHDLDEVAKECLQFQENDDRFVDDLLAMNGSSAGARPKILVTLMNKSFQSSSNPSNNHDDWIIKFGSSLDPVDIGPIEYAYHLMALAAGLNVPKARLFESKKSRGYFGVKRFDREGANRLHMHTVSGLLHIDHRMPSFDYETLLKATMLLTKDLRGCENQFRNAVFNVLTHNRDDHVKNFSFLMNAQGDWHVSPAYDLTFSMGPAGEHCTTVMGEGKHPGVSHLLRLAEVSSIEKSYALTVIDQVSNAVSQWGQFAAVANVTKKSSALIQSALNRVAKCK